MEKIVISIQQSHEFTPEDINDLVSTALEGGINYWCGSAKIKRNPDKTMVGVAPEDSDKVEFASDVIGYGGILAMVDAEDPDEKWELDLEKMKKGIAMHCEKEGIALTDLLDDYDADDADCIVQYALFGELVFG